MHARVSSVRTTGEAIALAVLLAVSTGCGRAAADTFYANADSKLIKIEIRDVNDVSVSEVGPEGVVGCGAMARAASGALYSVCGEGIAKPGPQQLATIDPKTGRATPFGQTANGLQIMGLKFGADEKIYTVGDTNPASPTFNSLYSMDVKTGAVTRIGSTGAPSFFHDLALARDGTLYATSADALYTIDVKSGTASKVADFVGGGMIMGLSFNADHSKLYATDFKKPKSDIYRVDLRTGFLTPVGTTGYPLAHGLAPVGQ